VPEALVISNGPYGIVRGDSDFAFSPITLPDRCGRWRLAMTREGRVSRRSGSENGPTTCESLPDGTPYPENRRFGHVPYDLPQLPISGRARGVQVLRHINEDNTPGGGTARMKLSRDSLWRAVKSVEDVVRVCDDGRERRPRHGVSAPFVLSGARAPRRCTEERVDFTRRHPRHKEKIGEPRIIPSRSMPGRRERGGTV